MITCWCVRRYLVTHSTIHSQVIWYRDLAVCVFQLQRQADTFLPSFLRLSDFITPCHWFVIILLFNVFCYVFVTEFLCFNVFCYVFVTEFLCFNVFIYVLLSLHNWEILKGLTTEHIHVRAHAGLVRQEKDRDNKWRWVLAEEDKCACTSVMIQRSVKPVYVNDPLRPNSVEAIRQHYNVTCEGQLNRS